MALLPLALARKTPGEAEARTSADVQAALRPLGIVVAVALALALRAPFLEKTSLWFDEAWSVYIAHMPLGDALSTIRSQDAHPPLYYFLLHFWMTLAGTSPVAVRMLSTIAGSLIVIPTWLIAERIGSPVLAAVSSLLVASSALAIQASAEARMYQLLALFLTSATLFLVYARENKRWWIPYACAMAAAFYTHYFAFLVFGAHLIFVLMAQERNFLRGFAGAVALSSLLYLPWWPMVWKLVRWADPLAAPWLGPFPPAAGPLNTLALTSFGGYFLQLGGYQVIQRSWTLPQVLLVAPFVVLAVLGARSLGRSGLLAVLGWMVPMGALVGFSLIRGTFFALPRYASFVYPFFAILLAGGVLSVAGRSRGRAGLAVAILVGIVVLNFAGIHLSQANPLYAPYRWASAAAQVREVWAEGDMLLFYPAQGKIPFVYYFSPPHARILEIHNPPWWRGIEDMRKTLPAMPLVASSPRVWVIISGPVPAGSEGVVLEAVERTHVRRRLTYHGKVVVAFYEKRR